MIPRADSATLPPRAVIYVRVSTAEQVTNYSLDTQLRACLDYCEQRGIEVVKVFREEGQSAKTTDRTQLQALIEFCALNAKKLGITMVVVHRVDRFARDLGGHTTVQAMLRKYGVQLRAVMEAFDETPQGTLIENVMAAMAQFDNDLRAQRTRDGMLAALRAGHWILPVPTGYMRPAGSHPSPSLVHDPERAPLIVRAFEMAAAGHAKTAIVAELTALGFTNRRGKALTPQGLGSLLTNKLYMGLMVVAKWDFDGPGDFEPIVNEDLFLRAQRPDRSRRGVEHARNHPDFPLRRVVRCDRCMTPLTGSWSKGRSNRYAYYRCPRRGCGVSVRKDRLEAQFLAQLDCLTARTEVFDLLSAVVRDAVLDRNADAVQREARLRARLDDLSARRDRVFDAFVQREAIDEETYREQLARIDVERARVTQQLADVGTSEVDADAVLDFARSLLGDLAGCWNHLEHQQRPMFASAMFPNRMTYGDDGLGTGHLPWLLTELVPATARDESEAAPSGFEPPLPP